MSRVVHFSEFGPASVLHLAEVDVPEPAPGKIRVSMRAAGINPFDVKFRRGAVSESKPTTFPASLGREVAGVVDAIGEGVTSLAVGDEVFGTVAGVGLAELVLTNPKNMARRPAGLPWEVAGGISVAGQTAWDEIESQSITDADTVLISAAAGGVGAIAAQLCVLRGATVIGTAGESNHETLREIGVVPVSYGPGLAERVRAVAPSPVTVVLDHHGAETIEAGLELGVPAERINTTAGLSTTYGVNGVGRGPVNPPTLEALADLVVAGKLHVWVEAIYPIADIVAAYERLEQGHLRGKIVIVP